jgi:hypothetical protein
MEFAKSRGYSIDNADSARRAEQYCWWCGTPMVISIEEGLGFDSNTGKPLHEAYGVCPRRPTFLGMLTKHRRKKITLDQDEMDKLLYDYVLDVTVPETQ